MLPQAARRVIGGLPCVEFPGEPGAPTVVFFHGYGADGRDLAPLAAEVPQKKRCRWVFPDGPLSLGEAYMGGRAWFEIDPEEIDRAQRRGVPVDWSSRAPAGLAESRAAALGLVAALGVPWGEVVLGGFSQGAVLAVDAGLRSPEAPRGLAILSGNLLAEAEWRALAPGRAGLPFFQSHGLVDPILSFRGARRLEALLAQAGLKGRLLAFEGGHTIPAEAVEALGEFLDALA